MTLIAACILLACVQGWEGTYGAVMQYMESLLPESIIKLVAPLVAKLTDDMGEYGLEIQVRRLTQHSNLWQPTRPVSSHLTRTCGAHDFRRACTRLWPRTHRRTRCSPWALW